MVSYGMNEQLRVGREGMERVKLLLLKEFENLVDYQDDRKKQQQGIDLRVQPWGTIEVKTDTHTTPNFFVEYECDGIPSGIMTSQADWWVYYFPNLELLYFIPKKNLLEYIQKNFKWLTKKYGVPILSHAGKRQWKARGIVIPRDFVCAATPVIIYEDFRDRLWLIAGRRKNKCQK